jgi:hypothetical protein
VSALKVVCAYCRAVITDGPSGPNDDISHGACNTCFTRLMAEIVAGDY